MKDRATSNIASQVMAIPRLLVVKTGRELQRFAYRRLPKCFGFRKENARENAWSTWLPARPLPARLRQLYQTSPVRHSADTFVLYRIIGNDLLPRHAEDQSRNNVAFILEHEPAFEACEKRWIVNRIMEPEKEAAIIALLEKYNQSYLRIPFDRDAYRRLRWDDSGLPSPGWIYSQEHERLDPVRKQLVQLHLRRQKTLYAMNNNGARNVALADGRLRAKWVLPFDGNCYFTADGFESLRKDIEAAPWYSYVIVPMARITDNSQLIMPGFTPVADEEPQVVFRADALECFDESIPYGRRPKVELLWRLAVPGIWDKFSFHPWDAKAPPYAREAGHFQTAGWVARLASGRADLEVGRAGFINRGAVRGRSIITTLDRIDGNLLAERFDRSALVFYDSQRLPGMAIAEPGLFAELMEQAEQAAGPDPHPLTLKTVLFRSAMPLDYRHTVTSWWPILAKKIGLPYQWQNRQRLPGTKPDVSGSGHLGLIRLQQTMEDTTILALAGTAAKRQDLLDRAALLVRSWFIAPATRMNPHLNHVQVRRGHNSGKGAGARIFLFKDLHYFLDAVRLLRDAQELTKPEVDSFREWLAAYSIWLTTSQAGMSERLAPNSHGTFFDVQLLSIALFLEDFDTAAQVCNGAWLRFSNQFASDGSLTQELKQEKPRHCVASGLAAWTALARLMAACGEDLWNICEADGKSLEKGLAWLASAWPDRNWAPEELEALPADVLEPFWRDCRTHFAELADRLPSPGSSPSPMFHPGLGHAPFWMLALP